MAEKEASTPTKYLSSPKKRPKRVSKGGRGLYCSIPESGSAYYDSSDEKKKSNIVFFKFPKNNARRNQWNRIIGTYRRKGENDNFTVTDSTFVCGFHFDLKYVKISHGVGRKNLTNDAVPTKEKA